MRLKSHLTVINERDDSLRTRMQECLHCIAFGIGKKKLTEEIWEMPDLLEKSYNSSCSLDTPFGELYAWAQKEPKWRESIIKASNLLHNSGWLRGKYKYHRNDAFMNSIYSEFKRLAKTEGIGLNNDKWNPADIWASKGNIKIPSVSNVMEYNKWIFDSMKSGKLIGVSLKMIAGGGKIVPQTPDDLPEPQEYGSIKSPKYMFPTGITIELKSPNYNINYRSFRISKQAKINGELNIKGTGARHGKVPSPLTRSIISDNNISQMSKNRINSMSDEELQNAVIELWADCGHIFSEQQMEKDWDKRKGDIQDRVGYWMSIINSLELGAYLNKSSKANDIVNSMWQAGKSADVNSSAFIKIY